MSFLADARVGGALGAASAVVGGALRRRRVDGGVWLVLAAGAALHAGGTMTAGMPAEAATGSLLVGYPLLALGLVLIRRRLLGERTGDVFEAAIAATALGVALWSPMFATFEHDGSAGSLTRVAAAAAPSFDILLVLLLARIVLTPSLRTAPTLLLVAGVAGLVSGDVLWLASPGARNPTAEADVAWLVGYALLACGSLHPAPLARDAADDPPTRRYALLGAPVALLPALLVAETVLGRRFTEVDALLTAGLLLLLLAQFGRGVRRLEAFQGELREQNRLKDELISVVSHDLRTPLTSIMGYLELALADETDPADRREFLEVVRRNTARLHRLVEDLLFVSRVQGGAQALELGPVDVGAIAEETVAAVRPTAEAAEVRLACRVESHAVILADGHRIAEVLENLLSNAIKFTPPGGDVDVWVGRSVSTLALRVTDTGVGISAQDRDHLFDRFFRARGSDGVPGAGLGLSIVKAIVDAHGGRIEVTSRVGAGTAFEVRLPIVLAEQRTIPVSGDGPSTLVRIA